MRKLNLHFSIFYNDYYQVLYKMFSCIIANFELYIIIFM